MLLTHRLRAAELFPRLQNLITTIATRGEYQGRILFYQDIANNPLTFLGTLLMRYGMQITALDREGLDLLHQEPVRDYLNDLQTEYVYIQQGVDHK